LWAGILLILVIVVAVVVWTLTLPKDVTGIDKGLSVKVPQLKGQAYSSAASTLKKLGLKPVEQKVASATVVPGAVINTTPGAGNSVSPHSTVVVDVSSGAAQISVPNIVGMTVAQATAALKAVGLTLGTSSTTDSATVAGGSIISSTPSSGSKVDNGSTVTIVLSNGKVDIPSVVGQSGSQAGSTLSSLHIDYSVVADSGCSGGQVTAQSIVGQQPQNAAMTITVCTGS
jgi:beta-lactam-binding protein with PASTA domain